MLLLPFFFLFCKETCNAIGLNFRFWNIFYDIIRFHLYGFLLPLSFFWRINREQNRFNQPSSSSTKILQCFYGVVITYKSLFYSSSLVLIITLIVVALRVTYKNLSVYSDISPLSSSNFVDPVLLFRVGPHYPWTCVALLPPPPLIGYWEPAESSDWNRVPPLPPERRVSSPLIGCVFCLFPSELSIRLDEYSISSLLIGC